MIYKNNAFILKKFNWRETSMIATFFTDGLGKIDGMLKAARVTPSRFLSTFDVFSYNEIIYYKKRSGLHLVVECYLKDNFSNVRQNIKASSTAKYFMELITKILPQEETNTEVFNLTFTALSSLEKNNNEHEKIARSFELHLLSMCGFKPHIESCISCQKEPLDRARFSLNLGGLICPNCFSKDTLAKDIIKGTISSIAYIQKNNWQTSMKLAFTEGIRNELRFILKNFLEFHLEKKLKASVDYS